MMRKLNGGTFMMGADDHIGFVEDYEGPSTAVTVPDFSISETTVTNQEFKKFVEATGYQTLAERIGSSFVFHILMPESAREVYPHPAGAPWWLVVEGADWAHPFGPESSIDTLLDHPVVHVALEDALAYCRWTGTMLPTEAEWEYAAAAGARTTYPWGDTLIDNGVFRANTWQGSFPWENDKSDGFVGTAPVNSFTPNKNGLYQMIGNVWEWCRNPRYTMLSEFNEKTFDMNNIELTGEYAIRGGSFLCHDSYCNRYRTAGRNGVDVQSTSSHLGFRTVKED